MKGLEYMALQELYEAVNQYKNHFVSCKDVDTFTDTEKGKISGNIKKIFSGINLHTCSGIDNSNVGVFYLVLTHIATIIGIIVNKY